MREHLPREILGQLVEELAEEFAGSQELSGRVGEYEVDGLTHGEDLRRLLVAHRDAVAVLELLHERVEVERVGLEILLEARLVADRAGIEVELVGEVLAHACENLVAGHSGGTLEAEPDDGRLVAAGGRDLSAPAAARAACVRPTTSPETPRAASRIACEKP